MSRRGFSLIELLVVISVIAILVGILLPALAYVRSRTEKVTCSSNLRQIGLTVELYLNDNKSFFPIARYMPSPFVSGSVAPPLYDVLTPYVPKTADGGTNRVYRCPDDTLVYPLASTSYDYNVGLSGTTIDQYWLIQWLGASPSQVSISRDFDGGFPFDLEGGGTLEVPFRHLERNIVFADGHVATLPP